MASLCRRASCAGVDCGALSLRSRHLQVRRVRKNEVTSRCAVHLHFNVHVANLNSFFFDFLYDSASKPAEALALALARVIGSDDAHQGGAESLCATERAKLDTERANAVSAHDSDSQRFVVALSLAEAESLRRLLHAGGALARRLGIALRTLDGLTLDRGALYRDAPPAAQESGEAMLLCLRFFNWYVAVSLFSFAQLKLTK